MESIFTTPTLRYRYLFLRKRTIVITWVRSGCPTALRIGNSGTSVLVPSAWYVSNDDFKHVYISINRITLCITLL